MGLALPTPAPGLGKKQMPQLTTLLPEQVHAEHKGTRGSDEGAKRQPCPPWGHGPCLLVFTAAAGHGPLCLAPVSPEWGPSSQQCLNEHQDCNLPAWPFPPGDRHCVLTEKVPPSPCHPHLCLFPASSAPLVASPEPVAPACGDPCSTSHCWPCAALTQSHSSLPGTPGSLQPHTCLCPAAHPTALLTRKPRNPRSYKGIFLSVAQLSLHFASRVPPNTRAEGPCPAPTPRLAVGPGPMSWHLLTPAPSRPW